MTQTYESTRSRLEGYFDRTASETWARLTSDAPVSRIRATVRAGRDRMRAVLLGQLPADLRGARVLDAGCGAGQTSIALAEAGADVVAVDIAPSLLGVARSRTPEALAHRIDYRAGDMADPGHGRFDFVIAMDSLIHYGAPDIAAALERLAANTRQKILFTVAPSSPLLTAMHLSGKLFPRSDRSPAIVPVSDGRLARCLQTTRTASWRFSRVERVSSGFYISQAMELAR